MKNNCHIAFCLCVQALILLEVKAQTNWRKNIYNGDTEVFLMMTKQNLTSTSGLANFTQITLLDLSNNELSSFGEIQYLTRVNFLSLTMNKIQTIEGLEHLTKVTELYL